MAMSDEPKGGNHASPPCFMHELEPGAADALPASDPVAAADVARWRKAERARLIAMRLDIPADVRRAHADAIARKLDAVAGDIEGRTVALYWPFRGEPDLRGWAARAMERGATILLPVVVEKAMPLVFRAWKPGDRLEKGVWNIPVPSDGGEMLPDVVVSPVVGFDAGNYRLGYGGGFYDRTLASLGRKPAIFGVGYTAQRLPTIYPQPFDIPMDVVLTEEGAA